MGEALAEARTAVARGERPHAAVAVVDDAMVARGHDRVHESDDPTAHAVIARPARGRPSCRQGAAPRGTIFCTMEPCPMCVGALLASDVEALVFAVPNRDAGAAGTIVQRADHPAMRRRIRFVSGIRRRRGRGALRGLRAVRRRNGTQGGSRSTR